MATLHELSEWEEAARSYWIDSLMAVDQLLEMNADDPHRGCLEVLRDAQDEALKAGRDLRALQERIARLAGPSAALPSLQGFSWPDLDPA